MARLVRLAIIPLALAPAAAPAVAQADAAAGPGAGGFAGAMENLKLYPLAATHTDPTSNVVGTSLGGLPVSSQPVSDVFSGGLPVHDLPLVGGLLQPVPGT